MCELTPILWANAFSVAAIGAACFEVICYRNLAAWAGALSFLPLPVLIAYVALQS